MIESITVSKFMAQHQSWYEVHWSIAQTEEGARTEFERKGLKGKFYKVYFILPTCKKEEGSFFAWWMPI